MKHTLFNTMQIIDKVSNQLLRTSRISTRLSLLDKQAIRECVDLLQALKSNLEVRNNKIKKNRSLNLDSPKREILSRFKEYEILSCGHKFDYLQFKYVSPKAKWRRCPECMGLKRKQIRFKINHPIQYRWEK